MLIVRDPESITIVGNVPNSPQFPKVCYCGKVGLKKFEISLRFQWLTFLESRKTKELSLNTFSKGYRKKHL